MTDRESHSIKLCLKGRILFFDTTNTRTSCAATFTVAQEILFMQEVINLNHFNSYTIIKQKFKKIIFKLNTKNLQLTHHTAIWHQSFHFSRIFHTLRNMITLCGFGGQDKCYN